jgi:glycosyltransferase involved in cell wall biosynthesis
MRIQHVITKADVGGAQTYALELATAQVADGHQVRIAAGTIGRMADIARSRGIGIDEERSLRREVSRGSDRRAARELVERLEAWRPDVVHAHSSKAGVLARLAARRCSVPAVYTAHGWPFQAGAPLTQRIMSWAGETFAAHRWGDVICLTDAEAARARRWKVVPNHRLHVVPNGLPDVDRAYRADTRAEETEPNAPPTVGVVMVARFTPPKAQRGVILALASIPDVPWRMTFVGDGAGLTDAVSLAKQLGLEDRIAFLGDRPDVPQILASHDIGLLFSRYEGMPLALLEAMRAGLACVANDLTGVRTLFGEDAGLTVAFEERSLAAGIRCLVEDPDERRRLGRAARARYEADFSIEVNARRVMDVYVGVIDSMRR